jgi:hypothetical protein
MKKICSSVLNFTDFYTKFLNPKPYTLNQISKPFAKFSTATVSPTLPSFPPAATQQHFSSPRLPRARPALPAAAAPALRFRVSWFRVSSNLKP